jgi:gas vesicle protein
MDALLGALVGALIGAIGALLVAWQTSKWEERRTRRDLALQRYREASALINDLILLAGERHHRLQRWLWSLQDSTGRYPEATRQEYYAVVAEWNKRNWSNRAQLRLSLGDHIALRFLDYRDDFREVPESLHYSFVLTHRAVVACEEGRVDASVAQRQIDDLNHRWSNFADDATVELIRRAADLRLLEVPRNLEVHPVG